MNFQGVCPLLKYFQWVCSFYGFTAVSRLSLNIEIISAKTYTDSKHFLFIVIFVNLRIFAGSVSHDVHSSMKRFSKVRAI